jgi:hypothetical protein
MYNIPKKHVYILKAGAVPLFENKKTLICIQDIALELEQPHLLPPVAYPLQ